MSGQTARAFAQLNTGRPDAALSTVAGSAALLNAVAATARRRHRARLLIQEPGGAATPSNKSSDAGAEEGVNARAAQRENLVGVVSAIAQTVAPSTRLFDAVAGAVESAVSEPAELTDVASATAVDTIGIVAAGGALLSAAAAQSLARGLSSVVVRAGAGVEPGPARRRQMLQQQLGAATDAAAAPPLPAPGPPPTLLMSILTVLDSLSDSLHAGLSVPGEDPALVAAPGIAVIAQLDPANTPSDVASGGGGEGGSRLFSQPLQAQVREIPVQPSLLVAPREASRFGQTVSGIDSVPLRRRGPLLPSILSHGIYFRRISPAWTAVLTTAVAPRRLQRSGVSSWRSVSIRLRMPAAQRRGRQRRSRLWPLLLLD